MFLINNTWNFCYLVDLLHCLMLIISITTKLILGELLIGSNMVLYLDLSLGTAMGYFPLLNILHTYPKMLGVQYVIKDYKSTYIVIPNICFQFSHSCRKLELVLLSVFIYSSGDLHNRELGRFNTGSKGIRQWPINSCTTPIMINKIKING